ncbi:hypothetical protein RND81_03G155100 [Saponaria officinalis]|uniref:Uncharacterized protein n=1 Tax=Saponaria officinalis TaxID=3572 RepID=A0AAW1M7B3_SAPOF
MENKLKTSLFCYSCCITDHNDEDVQQILQFSDHKSHHHHHHNLPTWLKSELPEFKDRCANIFSGKFGRNRHRGNFRYDPLSYALNFEDADSHLDDFRPHRNFSSRLPPSPPPISSEKRDVSTQISTWS